MSRVSCFYLTHMLQRVCGYGDGEATYGDPFPCYFIIFFCFVFARWSTVQASLSSFTTKLSQKRTSYLSIRMQSPSNLSTATQLHGTSLGSHSPPYPSCRIYRSCTVIPTMPSGSNSLQASPCSGCLSVHVSIIQTTPLSLRRGSNKSQASTNWRNSCSVSYWTIQNSQLPRLNRRTKPFSNK